MQKLFRQNGLLSDTVEKTAFKPVLASFFCVKSVKSPKNGVFCFDREAKFPQPNLSTSFDVRDVGCTVWSALRSLSKHKY